jgi:hypothetical protein
MATSSEVFGEQRLRLISGAKGSDGISEEVILRQWPDMATQYEDGKK